MVVVVEVVVVGISHPAEGNAFDTEQTSKRAGTSAGQKQQAVSHGTVGAMERMDGCLLVVGSWFRSFMVRSGWLRWTG